MQRFFVAQGIGGGHWDFWFCGFGYFLDSFFGLCAKKVRFFRFWCSLRFAHFPFFSIWFSVFAKNIDGFPDLIGLV